MGTTSSSPQVGRQSLERDLSRKERSLSLIARLKERSESQDSSVSRGELYHSETGHYILQRNSRVEAFDTWVSTITGKQVFRWRPARIRELYNDYALVAWDGYSERWDAKLFFREGKIRSPSRGPVVGPDGTLYYPMWTPEPPPLENGQVITPVAAPLPVRRSRLAPNPTLIEQKLATSSSASTATNTTMERPSLRQSGLRMRLNFFKKAYQSDNENENDDDCSSTHGGGEDASSLSDGETTAARRIEIDLGEEKAEDQASDEDGMESKEDGFLSTRDRRSVSTSSSMVVEPGVPIRPSTPPNPFRTLFRKTFQQPTEGTTVNKKSDFEQQETGESIESNRHPRKSDLKSQASKSANPGLSSSQPGAQPSGSSGAPTAIKLPSHMNRGQSGLANLGNTCFMNAVLQSLSHVPPLVDRLLREVQPLAPDENIDQPPQKPGLRGQNDLLARALCSLICDQWKSNPEKCRRPVEMKKIISNIAPQFEGHRQHDAQELLVCLLDGLHECLNRIYRRPTYVEIKPSRGLTEKELSYLYWDNYERGNDSFIKDLFCGQLMSRVTCMDCGLVSTSFDVFWDLSLCLPSTLPEGHQQLDVQDLLKHFCEVEKLTEDCGFKCERCKRWPTQGATKQLSIAMRPRVLVLHLKRFSHEPNGMTRKLSTPVSFPLKDLVVGDESYDLVSVVNHIGSFASGHYTADVYNPMTQSWFHADDASYTPTQHIGSNAYMLFYVESNKLVRAVKALCGI